MRKGREYYKNLIDEVQCSPIYNSNGLSVEELVDLQEYMKRTETKNEIWRKILIGVAIFYIISMLTSLILRFLEFEAGNLFIIPIITASIFLIFVTGKVSILNSRTFEFGFIRFSLNRIMDKRRFEINEYLKRKTREKNIGNILGS